MKSSVEFDEGDRQLTILGLAVLALSRPGFDHALGLIAGRMEGRDMFEDLKRMNADQVRPAASLAEVAACLDRAFVMG